MEGKIVGVGGDKLYDDLAKLKKGLTKVDTSGVLGFGRKVVHQFGAGFDKLVRLMKGHGWISRERSTMKEIDKTLKELTETHKQLGRVHGSKSNVPENQFEAFNQEIIKQVNTMRSICLLARRELGPKVSEREISTIEQDLNDLGKSCENALRRERRVMNEEPAVKEKPASEAPKKEIETPKKEIKRGRGKGSGAVVKEHKTHSKAPKEKKIEVKPRKEVRETQKEKRSRAFMEEQEAVLREDIWVSSPIHKKAEPKGAITEPLAKNDTLKEAEVASKVESQQPEVIDLSSKLQETNVVKGHNIKEALKLLDDEFIYLGIKPKQKQAIERFKKMNPPVTDDELKKYKEAATNALEFAKEFFGEETPSNLQQALDALSNAIKD